MTAVTRHRPAPSLAATVAANVAERHAQRSEALLREAEEVGAQLRAKIDANHFAELVEDTLVAIYQKRGDDE